jgi:hypothetical protein
MLDSARYEVLWAFQKIPPVGAIWNSSKNKDFSKSFRTFLWKTLHQSQKIGSYWLNITNFKHRGICHRCDIIDDIEHIVFGCDIPRQAIIWGVTKDLWAKKHNYWPEIRCIGSITGCGLMDFKDEQKKPILGANCLYRILISKATHLIWKLRNECIFKYASEEQWHPAPKIYNRWLMVINARLTLDQLSTNSKYGTKVIKPRTVLGTWSNILKNEKDLPVNWIKSPRVLVDVAPSEHPRGPGLLDDPP